jgi:hypothetical protein
MPVNITPIIETIMYCPILNLPTTYLGLPLTIRRPPKESYTPLITTIQKTQEGWVGAHLSQAGRVVLTNTILNVMPLNYMQVFLLPTWVIKTLTKITRRFLWR